jgi:hypothetical protein
LRIANFQPFYYLFLIGYVYNIKNLGCRKNIIFIF